MKRRITLSIALFLSIVLVSLTGSDQAINAQNQMRLVRDTGVVTRGADQELRITAAYNGDDNIRIRFRKIEYGQNTCSGGVCKQTVVSETTSAPITLSAGEAASFTCIPASVYGVRVQVLSNSQELNANAWIIDSVTGLVQSSLDDEDMGNHGR